MKAHLLYVEDDESLGFVTRDNLELQGYKVSHFSEGKSVIEAISNDHEFDLCILDVMLPEVDGFTIAEEIRKYDSQVPIIFLTAKDTPSDRVAGLKRGADDYLTKPFSLEELLLRVHYRYGRWSCLGAFHFGRVGRDAPGENWGGDIFASWDIRSLDTGVFTPQGNVGDLTYLRLEAAYTINPIYNLQIHAGYQLRQETSSIGGLPNSGLTYIGLRTNIYDAYQDF